MHQGRVNGISQVDGELRLVPANKVGRTLNKGTMALAHTALTSVPPALILKLVNSVPPHIPLALFKFCESRPLKRNAWDPSSQILWGLLFPTLVPWAGSPYTQGDLCSQDVPLDFLVTPCVWGASPTSLVVAAAL